MLLFFQFCVYMLWFDFFMGTFLTKILLFFAVKNSWFIMTFAKWAVPLDTIWRYFVMWSTPAFVQWKRIFQKTCELLLCPNHLWVEFSIARFAFAFQDELHAFLVSSLGKVAPLVHINWGAYVMVAVTSFLKLRITFTWLCVKGVQRIKAVSGKAWLVKSGLKRSNEVVLSVKRFIVLRRLRSTKPSVSLLFPIHQLNDTRFASDRKEKRIRFL
jgi:hypothetical protein